VFALTVWVLGFALLWVPGILLATLLRVRGPDAASRVTMQLGLGLCFWPLLLLWSSVLGLRVTSTMARAVFAIFAIGVIVVVARRFSARVRTTGAPALRSGAPLRFPMRQRVWGGLVLVLIGITAATRVSHIRDLVVPAWVDSVHHAAIIRLIIAQGRVPSTYDPLIPHGAPFYHWGYHSLTSFLMWILGQRDAFVLTDVMLHFGQMLNTLTVLFIYAAARALFQSRRAGLFAATLAAVVSYFPAYFVSWGRYTHLVGALLLLAFVPALFSVQKRPRWNNVAILGALAAGLLLVHVRLAFFALTLAAALAVFLVVGRSWRTMGFWAAAAVVAVLLTSPWLIRLAGIEQVRGIVAPGEALSDFRTPPEIRADHLWPPHNRELLAVATAGLTGLLGWPPMSPVGRMAAIAFWIVVMICAEWQHRKKPRTQKPKPRRRTLSNLRSGFWVLGSAFPLPPWRGLAVLALWVMITALLLNLDSLGLPGLQLASNTSAVISLFIPLSLAAGALIAWVFGCMVPRRWTLEATAALILAIAIPGAFVMRNVVNPRTVVATRADRDALRWIRDHTAREARFAVRARPWIANSWVGIDGGYWIPVLTDRQSILPPAIYAWASPPAEAAAINRTVQDFAGADSMTDDQLGPWLRSHRISHIYIGANSGAPTEDRFIGLAVAIYDQSGIKILEVPPAGD
jgi:hypothetical protein